MENGDFTMGNCVFYHGNGDFTMENGDFTMKPWLCDEKFMVGLL